MIPELKVMLSQLHQHFYMCTWGVFFLYEVVVFYASSSGSGKQSHSNKKYFYIKTTELKIRLQANEPDTGMEGPETKILKSNDGKVAVGLASGYHRFVSLYTKYFQPSKASSFLSG